MWPGGAQFDPNMDALRGQIQGNFTLTETTINNLQTQITNLQIQLDDCCSGEHGDCRIPGAVKYAYYSPNGLYGHDYALLNGKETACYLNDDGSLCAPYPLSDIGDRGTKPPGNLIAGGFPNAGNIASGLVSGTTPGQILPTNNPPCYGLLTSLTQPSAGELQFAIVQKREAIAGGLVNALDGWSIRGTNTHLQKVDYPSPPTPVYTGQALTNSRDAITLLGSLIVGTNTTVCTSMQAVTDSQFQYVYGFDGSLNELYASSVALQHTFELQRTNSAIDERRVYVSVYVRAISGSGGTMRYCRIVNPNVNWVNPNTATAFGSLVDGSFALSANGGCSMGLGSLEVGTILGVGNAGTGESTLLQRGLDGLSKYVELGAANSAQIKQRTALSGDYTTSDDTVLYSTSNYIGDAAFANNVQTQLGYGTAADRVLILISPEMNPDNGRFEFFYDAGAPVP